MQCDYIINEKVNYTDNLNNLNKNKYCCKFTAYIQIRNYILNIVYVKGSIALVRCGYCKNKRQCLF